MSDVGDRGAARRAKASMVDATVPNAARVADFLRGGTDNFAADREVVRAITAAAPAVERIPAETQAFRHRAIRYLVAEAGVRQFLDIGIGLAPPGLTHQVAQGIDPECRIVYAQSEPMALSRTQETIKSARAGSVRCVAEDIADVDAILASAPPTLDLNELVAIVLQSTTLAQVPTMVGAARAVSSLIAAVASGSYAVIYHLASDLDPAMPAAARQWNRTVPRPITLRSRADILSLVSGLDLVPPGVVPVNEWRPDAAPGAPVPVYGVVARKF